MRHNNAAFDLDGLLVDSMNLIVSGMKSAGYQILLDEKREFHFKFKKGAEPPKDFLWDVFFYRLFTERFDEIEPVDIAVGQFLRVLQMETGDPIRIITSRPKGALMHFSTEMLLDRLFPEIDFSIEVVGSWKEKIRYLYDKRVFFEDRRKTSVDMARRGITVFMRNTNYNHIGAQHKHYPVSSLDHGVPAQHAPGMIFTFDSFKELLDSKGAWEVITSPRR